MKYIAVSILGITASLLSVSILLQQPIIETTVSNVPAIAKTIQDIEPIIDDTSSVIVDEPIILTPIPTIEPTAQALSLDDYISQYFPDDYFSGTNANPKFFSVELIKQCMPRIMAKYPDKFNGDNIKASFEYFSYYFSQTNMITNTACALLLQQ